MSGPLLLSGFRGSSFINGGNFNHTSGNTESLPAAALRTSASSVIQYSVSKNPLETRTLEIGVIKKVSARDPAFLDQPLDCFLSVVSNGLHGGERERTSQPKKKRRRIDRSMIGEPTNFVHLTHIGSGEMGDGMQPSGPMQEQMRSKVPHVNGRNSLL
ncbi:hypothetical protein DNTS_012156 [Danionella cerebrum]|uniref:CRIB domain-containing protein n=1 Tax=Danionella cerebrum TaxID=2873325 RepID=A0A553Q8X9_9TELE|nr:hypothetical protein DNTS_012156 [Danionella translucida]